MEGETTFEKSTRPLETTVTTIEWILNLKVKVKFSVTPLEEIPSYH